MNVNKPLLSLVAIACLLFAACDKDDVSPAKPLLLTHEIVTPESVKYVGDSAGLVPRYYFKANGNEGRVVMTCKNFDEFNPFSGGSYTYDCAWATLKEEGNQLTIHFPRQISEAPDAYEEITISANDGKRTAKAIVCLSRTFNDSKPESLPEEAKFKMFMAEFTPVMHIESTLPAPLDLITFRITDVNGKYTPLGLPEFTQYYDSIVWSADGYPHTFKVYERKFAADESEEHLSTQWSSHFFKSGTVKSHLKGYRNGKVKYEVSLITMLYDRDFLGLQWGTIVYQKPEDLTAYCLLDRDYEYKVCDIVAKNDAPYSQIIPVNHKLLPDADFLPATKKAIKTLMDNNAGEGQDGSGKENLFKCLPEKGVKAEWYWENKTSRMLMLHRLCDDPDDRTQEIYYLHVEPK